MVVHECLEKAELLKETKVESADVQEYLANYLAQIRNMAKKNNVSIEVFQEDELSKKIHNIEQENKGNQRKTSIQSSNKQSSKSRKLLLDDDDHSRDDNDDEPVGKSKEIRTKKKSKKR